MAIERYYEPTWILNDNIAPGMESINSAKIPDGMADGEAPKLKFNYTVEIQFRSRIFDNGTTGKLGDEDPYLNKFAIIKATRPQPTINYQKVNFYNFRTNVATNVDYGTVNLVFYDDAANRAHDIFENYMYISSNDIDNPKHIKSKYVPSDIMISIPLSNNFHVAIYHVNEYACRIAMKNVINDISEEMRIKVR